MRKIVSLPTQKGQALITLLFFIVISISVTSAAVVMIMVNTLGGMKFQLGEIAYQTALSGVENAKLRLLRDTSYDGEVLTIGDGTATIEVTGGNPYVITSTGRVGNFVRKVQITATYNNNLLSASDPTEVY